MKLLPHFVNIVAWVWLIGWLICRCTIPFFIDKAFMAPPWIIIVNVIAIGLACFSSEAVEDEMISWLRLNSIAITAALYLVLMILFNVLNLAGAKTGFVEGGLSLVEDVSLWVFLYLLIFKVRIIIGCKKKEDVE